MLFVLMNNKVLCSSKYVETNPTFVLYKLKLLKICICTVLYFIPFWLINVSLFLSSEATANVTAAVTVAPQTTAATTNTTTINRTTDAQTTVAVAGEAIAVRKAVDEAAIVMTIRMEKDQGHSFWRNSTVIMLRKKTLFSGFKIILY